MEKNSKRGHASIIVINENGDAMQWPPNDDPQHSNCSNLHLFHILGVAGILTEELSKHLGQIMF